MIAVTSCYPLASITDDWLQYSKTSRSGHVQAIVALLIVTMRFYNDCSYHIVEPAPRSGSWRRLYKNLLLCLNFHFFINTFLHFLSAYII